MMTMSKNHKSLAVFIISFTFCLVAYVGVFFWQIGRPVIAEWWLKNTAEKKESISRTSGSSRIVFISGSNSLFGISGDVIAAKTGRDVVNLGLHAGLDIDYLVYFLKKNIKQGDIVIAPLEFKYYLRDEKPTSWVISNMLAWGGEYIKQLSMFEMIKFITYTSKDRIVEGVITGGDNKYDDLDKVLATPFATLHTYRPYNYSSLDRYGSMQMAYYNQGVLVRMQKQQSNYEKILSYDKNDLSFTSHAAEGILALKKIAESNGGEFYVTWPASIDNHWFNNHDQQSIIFTDNIKTHLNEIGVKVICDPFYSNLDFKLFTDTIYHLNRDGSVIRSERLAECLSRSRKK